MATLGAPLFEIASPMPRTLERFGLRAKDHEIVYKKSTGNATAVMNQPNHFYRAIILQPGGPGERVLTKRANKALAKRMAITESKKMNWDWRVEHCEDLPDDADHSFRVIEQWSSVDGHEAF